MQNFVFNAPTTVYFGKDEHKRIGEIVASYGYKKIMIEYGMGSAVKSGLMHEVRKSLVENGVSYVEMGGVEPNPKLSFIRKAVELAKKEEVELILAVGGGSTLDSSKFTALGAFNEEDVWEFVIGKAKPKGALPVGVVLTHSAAGSEMSNSAVMTNTELNLKKGFSSELNRCKFAVCNPELTYTLSAYQTACGIVDIMAHTMERYFTVFPETPLTDGIAETVLKTVISSGTVAIKRPTDYDARANIMWASSLSHNGLTGAGRENYLAVHQLEHALSGIYDNVTHGAGLAVLFPAWAKYVYKHKVKRFAQFARNVWGVKEKMNKKACVKGIALMEDFFKSIGMPTTLRELGVPKEAIPTLAENCTYKKSRTIKSYIALGYEEIKEIFEIAY